MRVALSVCLLRYETFDNGLRSMGVVAVHAADDGSPSTSRRDTQSVVDAPSAPSDYDRRGDA